MFGLPTLHSGKGTGRSNLKLSARLLCYVIRAVPSVQNGARTAYCIPDARVAAASRVRARARARDRREGRVGEGSDTWSTVPRYHKPVWRWRNTKSRDAPLKWHRSTAESPRLRSALPFPFAVGGLLASVRLLIAIGGAPSPLSLLPRFAAGASATAAAALLRVDTRTAGSVRTDVTRC